MNPSQLSALSLWLNSPLGLFLQGQEQQAVAEALDDVFGLQLLQVGVWGRPGEFFKAARTQRQTLIATSPGSVGDLCSSANALAVASDCVDAVLLPHTLEFEDDPHAVLREADRVLTGEGKLVILGFSATGPWAWRHRFSKQGFPPGLRQIISEGRLRDWLALLSFEIISVQRYLFRLPLARGIGNHSHGDGNNNSDNWQKHESLFLPASAYLIKAHKRVYTLTAVKPRWREKRRLVGGLVEPTTRKVSHRL